jgi:hypothetical protein
MPHVGMGLAVHFHIRKASGLVDVLQVRNGRLNQLSTIRVNIWVLSTLELLYFSTDARHRFVGMP